MREFAIQDTANRKIVDTSDIEWERTSIHGTALGKKQAGLLAFTTLFEGFDSSNIFVADGGRTEGPAYSFSNATTSGLLYHASGTEEGVGIVHQDRLSALFSRDKISAFNAGSDEIFTVDRFGSVNANSYHFLRDNNTGMYLINTDRLAFRTGNTQRMELNGRGYLGINRTDPDYRLDVGSDEEIGIAIRSHTLGRYGSTTPGLAFFDGGIERARIAGFREFSQNGHLIFSTRNNGTVEEAMRINHIGNVGIGTSNTPAKLTVDGTVRLATITGGTLETDALGNVTVSSDERLKDIQGSYTAGLDEVLNLNPIVYNWNAASNYDTSTNYAGFSAQNVEDFLPDAVGENSQGFKTLSIRPILAAVVNAVKELSTYNQAQDHRIEALELGIPAADLTRIYELESRLNQETERVSELEAEIEILRTLINAEAQLEREPDIQTDSATPAISEETPNTSKTPEMLEEAGVTSSTAVTPIAETAVEATGTSTESAI